jgi:hypothetical protein
MVVPQRKIKNRIKDRWPIGIITGETKRLGQRKAKRRTACKNQTRERERERELVPLVVNCFLKVVF